MLPLSHQQTLPAVMTEELLVVPSVQAFGQKFSVVLVRVYQIHQSLHITGEKKERSHSDKIVSKSH